MSDSETALEHLRLIRGIMEKATVYRAVTVPTALVSGGSAIVAAAALYFADQTLPTATVISIGTATLAAFIGAGGLGEPIVTGLALNDSRMILTGAIPAALLAIVTDLIFDALERRWIPPHLRASQLGP